MNLIIGNGLIGRGLYYFLRRMGDVVIIGRDSVDLNTGSYNLPVSDIAYICAGETSTEKCEREPIKTRRVNVENTVLLAKALLKKSKVVWLSSERVFDGSIPYRKITDEVCPTTEYGRQKADAERILLDMGVTVVRLSKVLGWDVPLFEGWIKDMNMGVVIHPYSNMSMAPMPLEYVTDILWRVGKQDVSGLCQVSGDRDVMYSDAAFYIANKMDSKDLVEPVECTSPHPYTTLESSFDVPDSWDTIQDWYGNKFPGGTQQEDRCYSFQTY